MEALTVLMRWLHLASMATIVGGILYARHVLIPPLESLPTEARSLLEEKLATRFRSPALTAMVALLVSGLYNVFINPGHSTRYYVILGVKLVLVLHVFSVVFLIVSPAWSIERQARRPRQMAGVIYSGFAIMLIAAYLRHIF